MAREVEIFLFSTTARSNGSLVQEILSAMDHNGNVTILDRDSVFSNLHMASAIMHAARSMIRGEARARAQPLEIIRWLTGSHQVSKGLEIAGPCESTSHILVVRIPKDWPQKSDMSELPHIKEEVWKGDIIEGLSPIAAPFELGGETAFEKMGLLLTDGSSPEEMEKSVLEAVCSLGLK